MENFQFCIPADIQFGKGQIENLPSIIEKSGKKVLLTYGGGSVIGCCEKCRIAGKYAP